jgi:4-diphosphocytidyl-2-C-methyl-D-erythritol kinase
VRTGWGRRWSAPAKLNLMLHVLGRRDDGYHELQTVFRFIDLCDELVFWPRNDGSIVRRVEMADIPVAADLCLRAARLLRDQAPAPMAIPGVEIELLKHIPVQAGLGGGSSDAATVLCVLNRLWGLHLPHAELMRLGLSLGADVPVFIGARNAWAEGIGEQLTPLDLPAQDYLVVQPDCAVSTAEIFGAVDLTRSTAPMTIQGFLAGQGGNDCTAPVMRRYRQVGEALDWLGAHGQARLSGTGACVFLACSRQVAMALLPQLPSRWRGWVVRGLAASPLAGELDERCGEA